MPSCTSTCIAKRIDIQGLADELGLQDSSPGYRDVLYWPEGDIQRFVFDFGVVVEWLSGNARQKQTDPRLTRFCEALHAQPLLDQFTYETGSAVDRVHGDHISLAGTTAQEMLGVSYGLAQSSKLEEFEAEAEQTIEQTAHIPRSIAKTGSSRLSRRIIARKRGQLFLVESNINLHYALLDTPEFFWEYPELESLYNMTARYLDVQSRIEVLNHKLSTIHGLFTMLAEEQKHRHSSLLEWIIIWLIAIEIVIFFYEWLHQTG